MHNNSQNPAIWPENDQNFSIKAQRSFPEDQCNHENICLDLNERSLIIHEEPPTNLNNTAIKALQENHLATEKRLQLALQQIEDLKNLVDLHKKNYLTEKNNNAVLSRKLYLLSNDHNNCLDKLKTINLKIKKYHNVTYKLKQSQQLNKQLQQQLNLLSMQHKNSMAKANFIIKNYFKERIFQQGQEYTPTTPLPPLPIDSGSNLSLWRIKN